MFRGAPDPKEPRVAVRVQLPRRLADRLAREAQALASPLVTPTQARDALVERLIQRGLEYPARTDGYPVRLDLVLSQQEMANVDFEIREELRARGRSCTRAEMCRALVAEALIMRAKFRMAGTPSQAS